jgi:hypothetical protein
MYRRVFRPPDFFFRCTFTRKLLIANFIKDTVLVNIPRTTFSFFVFFLTFLGANDAPRDLLQYVLWIGSQTKFLTKLWTFEKSPVWSVCVVTVIGARFATTKLWFRQKPTLLINFWFFKNALIVFSSGSSTHRHASTRSCYDIYGRLWKLSVPTFRIFEDFDWAPVIFTQDIQRKTYTAVGFYYENIFFQKIKNRSRWSYAELDSAYLVDLLVDLPRYSHVYSSVMCVHSCVHMVDLLNLQL